MTERDRKRYLKIIERREQLALKKFEQARLRDRARMVGSEEAQFWTEFYNLTVKAYAKAFGPKYLPETFADNDRMLVGPGDWDALITAVKHVQGYLGYLSDYLEGIAQATARG